ncbi:pol polyprotein, partial [Fusarium austroafricanum]
METEITTLPANKEIDHLKVLIQGKNQGVDFDILPLGPTDILLGMPWLKRVNPHIDWPTGQVTIPSNTDRDDRTITTNNERSQAQTEEDSKGMRESKDPPIPKGTQHQHQLHDLDDTLKAQQTPPEGPDWAGMAKAQWPKNETTQDRLHNIPLEYRRYKKLFSEELKTKKIYNLNEKELTTLRDYLETELAKGNIRISTSSAGFPVMFVPKKNRKLRLVVDYRRLNALTIKDRTPLPLITELKDRLRGKQIFTALDLKGAYNL